MSQWPIHLSVYTCSLFLLKQGCFTYSLTGYTRLYDSGVSGVVDSNVRPDTSCWWLAIGPVVSDSLRCLVYVV